MADSDCTHDWKNDGRGKRCTKCQWFIDDGGPLPEKGLGIGLFKLKEEEGEPTRNYVDQ